MKKELSIVLAIVAVMALIFLLTGCTDAWWASRTALGNPHKVELYQNGRVVMTWFSTGKVESGDHGTRFAFVDRDTGAYTRMGVANVVVTTLDD